jgi:hypothetical protein
MLKFLVFVLLVIAVIAFFAMRQTPKRPPRDWRHGGDDGGPVPPLIHIGSDASRKPAHDTGSGDDGKPVKAEAGAPDGNGCGGDGGGGD